MQLAASSGCASRAPATTVMNGGKGWGDNAESLFDAPTVLETRGPGEAVGEVPFVSSMMETYMSARGAKNWYAAEENVLLGVVSMTSFEHLNEAKPDLAVIFFTQLIRLHMNRLKADFRQTIKNITQSLEKAESSSAESLKTTGSLWKTGRAAVTRLTSILKLSRDFAGELVKHGEEDTYRHMKGAEKRRIAAAQRRDLMENESNPTEEAKTRLLLSAQKSGSYFFGYDESMCELIARSMVLLTAKKGEHIIKAGADANFVAIMLQGKAEVTVAAQDKQSTVTVSEITPGAIFGEMAFFQGGIRGADVVASSDIVSIAKLDITVPQDLNLARPGLGFQITKMFALSAVMSMRFSQHNLAPKVNQSFCLLKKGKAKMLLEKIHKQVPKLSKDFTVGDLLDISDFMQFAMHKRGKVVYHEGSEMLSTTLVLDGTLELRNPLTGGQAEAWRGRGEWIGDAYLMESFNNKPEYTYDVAVTQNSTIGILTKSHFMKMMKDNPQLAFRLLLHLDSQLIGKLTTDLAVLSSTQRIRLGFPLVVDDKVTLVDRMETFLLASQQGPRNKGKSNKNYTGTVFEVHSVVSMKMQRSKSQVIHHVESSVTASADFDWEDGVVVFKVPAEQAPPADEPAPTPVEPEEELSLDDISTRDHEQEEKYTLHREQLIKKELLRPHTRTPPPGAPPTSSTTSNNVIPIASTSGVTRPPSGHVSRTRDAVSDIPRPASSDPRGLTDPRSSTPSEDSSLDQHAAHPSGRLHPSGVPHHSQPQSKSRSSGAPLRPASAASPAASTSLIRGRPNSGRPGTWRLDKEYITQTVQYTNQTAKAALLYPRDGPDSDWGATAFTHIQDLPPGDQFPYSNYKASHTAARRYFRPPSADSSIAHEPPELIDFVTEEANRGHLEMTRQDMVSTPGSPSTATRESAPIPYQRQGSLMEAATISSEWETKTKPFVQKGVVMQHVVINGEPSASQDHPKTRTRPFSSKAAGSTLPTEQKKRPLTAQLSRTAHSRPRARRSMESNTGRAPICYSFWESGQEFPKSQSRINSKRLSMSLLSGRRKSPGKPGPGPSRSPSPPHPTTSPQHPTQHPTPITANTPRAPSPNPSPSPSPEKRVASRPTTPHGTSSDSTPSPPRRKQDLVDLPFYVKMNEDMELLAPLLKSQTSNVATSSPMPTIMNDSVVRVGSSSPAPSLRNSNMAKGRWKGSMYFYTIPRPGSKGMGHGQGNSRSGDGRHSLDSLTSALTPQRSVQHRHQRPVVARSSLAGAYSDINVGLTYTPMVTSTVMNINARRRHETTINFGIQGTRPPSGGVPKGHKV